MNELDDNGWGNIHYAAARGYTKSIARFIVGDPEQLEQETGDGTSSTPFLIAVSYGSIESVQRLIELGARVSVVDAENRGAIELCVLKHHIALLEYFIRTDLKNLNVWECFREILASEGDDEVENAGKCLCTLTQPRDNSEYGYVSLIVENKIIPALLKVLTSQVSDQSKIPVFQTVLNLIGGSGVVDVIVESGGIPILLGHMKAENTVFLHFAAQITNKIGLNDRFADLQGQNNAISIILELLKTYLPPSIQTELVDCLGNIARSATHHQSSIGQYADAVETLVHLFDGCSNKTMLLSLTSTVSELAREHEVNQNSFVAQGIAKRIVAHVNQKPMELQVKSVDAVFNIVNENSNTQLVFYQEGTDRHLLQALRKSRNQTLQEKTGCALWAIAGYDFNVQKAIADGIGVHMLIEFLNSSSERLHYIGSEGISVLAQGPTNLKSEIATASGIYPIVRLLRASKSHIVLSVIRTLRHICVDIGYVADKHNQTSIFQCRGLHFLIALLRHSGSDLIKAEAALTLASVALSNSVLLNEIKGNGDFSYSRVMQIFENDDETVRLLAGLSIATFAYNNIAEQREIAKLGGISIDFFLPLLQSCTEIVRCLSSFQVVVLARVIPDQEQANSSAVGIKLLVDLVQGSQSEAVCALAADCLARLAHTRAGIPAAMVAIDVVDYLCELMQSACEAVRGCAAKALIYLSYNHAAQRKLLNRCRINPALMKVILGYCYHIKLPPSFMDTWLHYKKIGLPPIEGGKVSVVTRESGMYKGGKASTSDSQNISMQYSLESNLNRSGEEISSHYSRTSRLTVRSSLLDKTTPSMSARISISNPSCRTPLFPDVALDQTS